MKKILSLLTVCTIIISLFAAPAFSEKPDKIIYGSAATGIAKITLENGDAFTDYLIIALKPGSDLDLYTDSDIIYYNIVNSNESGSLEVTFPHNEAVGE